MIAHTVPAALKMRVGSAFSDAAPGFHLTTFDTGPVLAREWFRGQLAGYTFTPVIGSASALEELRWWLRHVRSAAGITWVVEPISRTHPPVLSGPLTDGTMTTFCAGMMAPSTVAAWVGDEYQDGGYTVRAASNLLTDDQANVVAGTTGLEVYGTTTIARSVAHAFDGVASIWCKPAGSQPNIGAKVTAATAPAVVSGRDYTARASFRGAGTMAVSITWLDSSRDVLSTEAAVTATGSATADVDVSITAEAVASAEYAAVNAYRTTDSAAGFFVGCLGLAPGDYSTWHLPSAAPGLLEFATAPATRKRIAVLGTGQRVTRCVGQPALGWVVGWSGSVFPQDVKLREAPEY